MKRPLDLNSSRAPSRKPKAAATGGRLFKEKVLDKYRGRDFWASYWGTEAFILGFTIWPHERRTRKDRKAAAEFMFWVVRQLPHLVKDKNKLAGPAGRSRERYVSYAIAQALIFGADPDARDAVGNTILFYRESFYNIFPDMSILKVFVAAGGNVNARNKFGETALHYYGDYDRLHGADPSATDRWGDTPLHTAARLQVGRGDLQDLIKISNVNAVNHKGQTPLFHAMYHPHRKPRTLGGMFIGLHPVQNTVAVKLLLDGGANVNHADIYGRTPMHVAAMHGETAGMADVARMLKVYGASIHAVDRSGRTPLAYVARGRPGKGKIAELLETWTSHYYFGNVRRLRSSTRENIEPDLVADPTALRVNQALATFMRDSAPRMPDVPAKMKRPKFLYRGVYGIEADLLREKGYIDSKSYIATSRALHIANRFTESPDGSSNGLLLKIPFESIPHGTPMVWFIDPMCGRMNRQAHSVCGEHETLLPPGRLQIVRKDELEVLEVRYTPDLAARAKFNIKPIVRQPGRAKRNINDAGAMRPWMQTYRLFGNSGTTRASRLRARSGRA